MAVTTSADEPGSARFTRSTFMLGSLGFAASVAGIQRLRFLDTATAATAIDSCGWVPWEMVHGLARDAFNSKDAELTAAGYRLVRISGYGNGSDPLLTGIWESRPSSDHIFELVLTRANFKDRNSRLQRNGYRLLAVDGFSLNGADRYNGIWERSPGSPRFELGIKAQPFRDKIEAFRGDGYRLVDVSAFELNGSSRFAGLWRKDGPTSVIADIEMSETHFSERVNSLVTEGFLPVDVSAHQIAGATRYAAIWTKFSVPIGLHELLDEASLNLESDARRYRGWRPIMVDAYPRDAQAAYKTVWRRDGITATAEEKLVEAIEGPLDELDEDTPFMEKYAVPGLSLAFAKNGRLVYARGFGVTAKDGTEPVTVHSRFRIGSASKPLTAVAIMHLVERNVFELSSKVFGPGTLEGTARDQPLLGTHYGDVDWDSPETAWMREVTVQHLLEHTAGWPNTADPNDPEGSAPNPMDAPRHTDQTKYPKYPEWLDQDGNAIELDRENLIDYVITNSTGTLDNRETWAIGRPGLRWSYSGFGYLLLTKIIEHKSGMTYEDYVKQVIVDDPDSTLEMCSRRVGALSNEVSYYAQPTGQPHDNFEVWRRAGGGGWVASAIDLVRFMTRVDGEESTRSDAIDWSTLNSMLTSSEEQESQGLGWLLDRADYEGPQRVDYWHGGTLSGSNSVIAAVKIDGSVYCWAAVKNTLVQPPKGSSEPNSDLDGPMREFFALISEWLISQRPCLDLF